MALIQCVGNRQIKVTHAGGTYSLEIILARPDKEAGHLATLVLEPAEVQKLVSALPAKKVAPAKKAPVKAPAKKK
jgi:hypothetical protein